MATVKMLSKFEQLKRNLSITVKQLFTKDAEMDIDDEAKDMLLKLGYIEVRATQYDLTKLGKKEFAKAIKTMSKKYAKDRR